MILDSPGEGRSMFGGARSTMGFDYQDPASQCSRRGSLPAEASNRNRQHLTLTSSHGRLPGHMAWGQFDVASRRDGGLRSRPAHVETAPSASSATPLLL
jgi:hypothetical protein